MNWPCKGQNLKCEQYRIKINTVAFVAKWKS